MEENEPRHQFVYPDHEFEKALIAAFPKRKDVQDLGRISYYDDFEPQVDSYGEITEEVLDTLWELVTSQQNKRDPRQP